LSTKKEKILFKRRLIEILSGIPDFSDENIVLLKNGFGIKDKATGVEYTVVSVDASDQNNLKLYCIRYNLDGSPFETTIDSNNFKNYVRA